MLDLFAVGMSLAALAVVIFPRVKQGWTDYRSISWAIGGVLWYVFTTIIFLSFVAAHTTISIK